MVNRPFSEKWAETQGFIAKNIHIHKNPTVAWSGGKDSTLVLWLCLKLKPDILTVFNNTGVEYPETVKFIHWLRDEWKVKLIETHPIKSFWDCARKYGFVEGKSGENGKHQRDHCCYYLKESRMSKLIRSEHIDSVFTGLTAVENRTRMLAAGKYGACYHFKRWNCQKVHPILWWTEAEVRQFHTDMNIPLNPIYLKADRCGCMPCTAFKSWESQLSQTNPKMYAIIKRMKDKQFVMTGVL